MEDEPEDQPTQETREGLPIPVPTRDEIEDALTRIAAPDVDPDNTRSLRDRLRRKKK
jgi:hypothetical protein